MATKDKTDDGAFADVSKQVDQVAQDAEKPAEFNDDGTLKVDTSSSKASLELSEELNRRTAAIANGGGPFPVEVLRRRFIGNARKMERPAEQYTSHES